MTRLLGYTEAAELLGVCERTIAALKAKNEIPYIPIGKRVKFSEESLKLWLRSKEKGTLS